MNALTGKVTKFINSTTSNNANNNKEEQSSLVNNVSVNQSFQQQTNSNNTKNNPSQLPNNNNNQQQQQPQKSTFEKLETSLLSVQEEFIHQKTNIDQSLTQSKEQFNKQVTNIQNSAQSFIRQQKDQISKWVSRRVQQAVLKALEKSRPAIKNGLKDPDMCDFVKNWVDDLVDYVWPTVVEEAQYMLKMNQEQPFVELSKDSGNKDCPCFFRIICAPFWYIRNKYVYAMQPYDQSFWKQIKSVWYWIFFIISIFPQFGVQPCFYVFIFLCIDKSDEYQLVQYILDFKKMQFVTQGVINGTIGYLQYFQCLNLNKNINKYSCNKDDGPGAQIYFYYDVVVYCLQVLMIWMAFIMLPCSKQKGKPRFKYDDNNEEEEFVAKGANANNQSDFNNNNNNNDGLNGKGIKQRKLLQKQQKNCCCCCDCNLQRGGALKMIMIYDIICFAISVYLLFAFISYNEIKESIYFNNYLYFIFIFYGLLSFPFLIFAVGPLGNLITKSKPTAYDRYGNCVPTSNGVQIKYTKDNAVDLNFDVEDILK